MVGGYRTGISSGCRFVGPIAELCDLLGLLICDGHGSDVWVLVAELIDLLWGHYHEGGREGVGLGGGIGECPGAEVMCYG